MTQKRTRRVAHRDRYRKDNAVITESATTPGGEDYDPNAVVGKVQIAPEHNEALFNALMASTTPGGDLPEQAAREKVELLFDQAFADGIAAGKSGDDSILAGSSSAYAQAAIRALKPAGDGGEA